MTNALTWSLAILLVTAAALPTPAHARRPGGGAVEIEVVSDDGRIHRSVPHRTFWNGGTQVIKRYIEAQRGEQYGIIVRNRSDERVGVVIAVDGRNIITGSRSDLRSREAMYVVNAGEDARYDGWRTSRNEVHRFYFTSPGDSYSVRTFGDTSAMGLIAVAVYREKERPVQHQGISKRESGPAPPAGRSARDGAGAPAEERAGTGFGDRAHSPVVTVAFEPELRPLLKALVKYEWREVLCRKGIVNCGDGPGNRLWDDARYAPFPPAR